MSSFNQCVLVGNLTRDPELRYTAGRKAVCDVGLAINDRYKKNDEWIEETTFVDVTFWGRTAEVVNEYLSNGSPILVQGKLKLESWEKDGQKKSKHKIVCEQMRMLGGRNSDNQATAKEEEIPVGTGADDTPY